MGARKSAESNGNSMHSSKRLGSALDARGRRVTILDPGVDWLLGRDDQIDKATLDRIMTDLGVEARRSRRIILGGMAFVVALIIIAGVLIGVDVAKEGPSARQDLLQSLVYTGPAVFIMFVAGVATPIMIARRKRLAGAQAAMLRHGHCPHCGYRIAETPKDPKTGHAVCPECGSAWAA